MSEPLLLMRCGDATNISGFILKPQSQSSILVPCQSFPSRSTVFLFYNELGIPQICYTVGSEVWIRHNGIQENGGDSEFVKQPLRLLTPRYQCQAAVMYPWVLLMGGREDATKGSWAEVFDISGSSMAGVEIETSACPFLTRTMDLPVCGHALSQDGTCIIIFPIFAALSFDTNTFKWKHISCYPQLRPGPITVMGDFAFIWDFNKGLCILDIPTYKWRKAEHLDDRLPPLKEVKSHRPAKVVKNGSIVRLGKNLLGIMWEEEGEEALHNSFDVHFLKVEINENGDQVEVLDSFTLSVDTKFGSFMDCLVQLTEQPVQWKKWFGTVPSDDIVEEVKRRREMLEKSIDKVLAPRIIMFVWHSVVTFYGMRNGPFKTILPKAASSLLDVANQAEDFNQHFPILSYADLIQLAGVVAIEVCGGPKIPFRPGRQDNPHPPQLSRIPNSKMDANQLKHSFREMGFDDRELVLIFGIQLECCRIATATYSSAKDSFYNLFGGNTYFKKLEQKSRTIQRLLLLPSEKALVEDKHLMDLVHSYVWGDYDLDLCHDYARAHVKLSEIGFGNMVRIA